MCFHCGYKCCCIWGEIGRDFGIYLCFNLLWYYAYVGFFCKVWWVLFCIILKKRFWIFFGAEESQNPNKCHDLRLSILANLVDWLISVFLAALGTRIHQTLLNGKFTNPINQFLDKNFQSCLKRTQKKSQFELKSSKSLLQKVSKYISASNSKKRF